MPFCDRCHNLFDVTRTVKTTNSSDKGTQKKIKQIFDAVNADEPIDEKILKGITIDIIKSDDQFSSLTTAKQKYLTDLIADLGTDETDVTKKVFYSCNICGHSRPIDPGTVVYYKNYEPTPGFNVSTDYSIYCTDNTLPRTKKYVCANNKCESLNNPGVREAVMIKTVRSELVYVCCACKTYWSNI